MSNTDLIPTETRLALFTDQSPADCAAGVKTFDLLAEIQIEDADHRLDADSRHHSGQRRRPIATAEP